MLFEATPPQNPNLPPSSPALPAETPAAAAPIGDAPPPNQQVSWFLQIYFSYERSCNVEVICFGKTQGNNHKIYFFTHRMDKFYTCSSNPW